MCDINLSSYEPFDRGMKKMLIVFFKYDGFIPGTPTERRMNNDEIP
jgi:hypothetical protein